MVHSRMLTLLLVATLFLAASPLLRVAVAQGAVAADSVAGPASETTPEAAAACASLSDVTSWIGDFTFSWNDAAEGEILGHVGVASVHRQAMSNQRLGFYRQLDGYERWDAFIEDGHITGQVVVDDRAVSHDGQVDYESVASDPLNDDNVNAALLDVFPDCTYDLDFGFASHIVHYAGGLPPDDSNLLAGKVFLRGQLVPDTQFGVVLAGSASVPYDSSALDSDETAFVSGADPGQNWISTIREGPTYADAHVTWRLVPAGYLPCAERTTPIDASDPNLDAIRLKIDVEPDKIAPNQGNSLTPPDPAKLTIRATCGFAPVRNAQIRVAVEAKRNSGGHLHNNGAFPRPRGYLNPNATGNFTEITAQTQFILVQTDATGKAVVYFRPGTDFSGGGALACSGKQRGISGTYEVSANSTIPRFSANVFKQAVTVARSDFTPIAAGPLIDLFNSAIHPKGTSGTPTTIAAINALAAEFNRVQLANNTARTLAAQTPWRIVKLPLVDASLQDGGLYETGGIDVCQSGQPLVPFRDWHIPHQTHMAGSAVDIKTSVWSLPSDADNAVQVAWWRNTLRAIGCYYGTWARERVSFHLDVNQTAATHGQFHSGCQFVADPLQQGLAATSNAPQAIAPQANMPDLFVTMLPDAPEEEVRLAAGQSVTYSVGLSNLYGDVIAPGARVSVTLPTGLSFVGSNPPALQEGNVLGWVAGDLPAHALPAIYFFAVKADVAVVAGTTLTLTAQAFSSDAESTTENNVDRAPLFVTLLGPDILVESNLDEAAMTVNAPISVTFEAANLGNAPAPNTKLRLNLPPNTIFSSASLTPTSSGATFVEWSLGTMEADSTRTLAVALTLDAALAVQPITPFVNFETQMTTSATDTRLANNTATYIEEVTWAGHDLQLWMQVAEPVVQTSGGEIASGDRLTYTLTVGNFGNEVAQSATVTMTLAASMTVLSANPAATVNGPLQWELGDLPVGEVHAIEVVARVDALPSGGSTTGAITNALNPDLNLLNNRAEDVYYGAQAAAGGGTTYIPAVTKEK